MKRANKDRMVNTCLLLIGILGLAFSIISNKNDNKVSNEYEEAKKINKQYFAMYIEDDSGNYVEYESNVFPSGYILNANNSQCVDINNNVVDGILSNIDNNVTVTTNKTVFCYLYFDIPPLTLINYLLDEETRPSSLWTSALSGDGYGFVGGNKEVAYCTYNNGNYTVELENSSDGCPTIYYNSYDELADNVLYGGYASSCKSDANSCKEYSGVKIMPTPDNYICFGTSDQDACVENTDLYMYRIIGIFKDSSGNNHLKLIKKEALNITYYWENSNSDINWGDSDLYMGLNGSYFLANTSYAYMQNTEWADMISKWWWSASNTKTDESSGPNYTAILTREVYYHEMNHVNKSSSVGEWTAPSGKIGLIYVSDYMMSLGIIALNYLGSSDNLTTGWMYLGNNDAGTPHSSEWTMSRSGYSDLLSSSSGITMYTAYFISSSSVSHMAIDVQISARPVFYLNSDVIFESGSGTATDPFIIS